MAVTLRRSARNIRKTSRVPRSAFLIFLAHYFQRISVGRGALLSQPPNNSVAYRIIRYTELFSRSPSNRNPKNGFPTDALVMTIKIGRNLKYTMFHKFCYKMVASWDAFKNFNQNQVLISKFCLLRAENGARSKWQFFTKEPLVQEAYSNLANSYSLLMTHCADSVTAEIRKTNRMVGLTPLCSLFNENSCIQRHTRLNDEDIDTIMEITVGYDFSHRPISNANQTKHFSWEILSTKEDQLSPCLTISQIINREVMKCAYEKDKVSSQEIPSSGQIAEAAVAKKQFQNSKMAKKMVEAIPQFKDSMPFRNAVSDIVNKAIKEDPET
jgi:hypothetical protein